MRQGCDSNSYNMGWPSKQIPAWGLGCISIIRITRHLHPFLDFTKNTKTLFHFVMSLTYDSNYTLGTLVSQTKNCTIICLPFGETKVPMH